MRAMMEDDAKERILDGRVESSTESIADGARHQCPKVEKE
jgi:hypothetical protein